MNNDWRKYVQTDKEFAESNEDDENPRKVLQEEFDFLAKNWYLYLVAAFLGFSATALIVWVFLSIMGAIYN